MEHFVGIDLHKDVSQMAVLRESRSPSQLRFANDVMTAEQVLKKLPKGSKIAVEAMGSWWWMVELAQKTGHEVFLSHPKQTKAIASARLKSDKVDALMLAKLLKADLLPTVWIPPEKQRHVFNLRYYDEMPYDEMSKILDTSAGALKASYHHAAKKIEEFILNN